ncbi:hypothetical protein NQ318_016921 [Aromia moschata]|uniref:Myb-like, SWIRM and MPN domain-containing protein 1 n=1 Tax=Aromia moschata TaxID=1265417 RepID=A0AAV8X4Y5_9CUCU|nr:hypothetical protein NQ318_016921 [Aromia moschata]
MAEEDEIDVLGDFSLDNFLGKSDSSIYGSSALVSQNTELLNCDYTIHPQWLLDKPSPNPDNWYGTNLSTGLLEKTQTENDTLGHVSTENSITDESGWTEKEKNLLQRGIEIFGKSNVRLSQFIGSKTAAEVRYYLKNFYLESQTVYRRFNDGVVEDVSDTNLVSDILDDTQIPASIEQVIAAVSTAKPTVHIHKRPRNKSFSSNADISEVSLGDIPSGQSLLKSNYMEIDVQPFKSSKFKKGDLCNKQRKQLKNVKFKLKNKLKVPVKHSRGQEKHRAQDIITDHAKEAEFSKVEITTGRGLAVPICEGEEIVKIKKVDDDSDLDVEIDVEDSDGEKEGMTLNIPEKSPRHVINTQMDYPTESNQNIEEFNKTKNHLDNTNLECKEAFDLSTLNESTLKKLMSLETPKSEVTLDKNAITELEEVIHHEFFQGRTTKNPQRYLMIRNHIINTWNSQKPNYVRKTSIRSGLRNCGDVNSVGRIHYFLEQIGAINFSCAQVNYIRPLYDMIKTSAVKEKTVRDSQDQANRLNSDVGCRPRIKKKFNNDGEGGCTLTHDEKGHVIKSTIINEEPVKPKSYIKKPSVRLIYCRPFSVDKPQPYTIRIHLSTLLTMDFHAHTSLTEIMGLVAGYWVEQNRVLIISHYEPCLNIASSATHCDMCPISQAKAADIIHGKGLDILGWFHSHPTFAPEPSHQDMETQQFVQKWIGYDRPCVGIILSPFCSNGALIASPYRCMIVDKKLNFEDQLVPYKFKVELITDNFVVNHFLKHLRRVFKCNNGDLNDKSKVDFDKPYLQDPSITYLEKYITSVRMHLAKCGTLSKMTCDSVIRGITDICANNKISKVDF